MWERQWLASQILLVQKLPLCSQGAFLTALACTVASIGTLAGHVGGHRSEHPELSHPPGGSHLPDNLFRHFTTEPPAFGFWSASHPRRFFRALGHGFGDLGVHPVDHGLQSQAEEPCLDVAGCFLGFISRLELVEF